MYEYFFTMSLVLIFFPWNKRVRRWLTVWKHLRTFYQNAVWHPQKYQYHFYKTPQITAKFKWQGDNLPIVLKCFANSSVKNYSINCLSPNPDLVDVDKYTEDVCKELINLPCQTLKMKVGKWRKFVIFAKLLFSSRCGKDLIRSRMKSI